MIQGLDDTSGVRFTGGTSPRRALLLSPTVPLRLLRQLLDEARQLRPKRIDPLFREIPPLVMIPEIDERAAFGLHEVPKRTVSYRTRVPVGKEPSFPFPGRGLDFWVEKVDR